MHTANIFKCNLEASLSESEPSPLAICCCTAGCFASDLHLGDVSKTVQRRLRSFSICYPLKVLKVYSSAIVLKHVEVPSARQASLWNPSWGLFVGVPSCHRWSGRRTWRSNPRLPCRQNQYPFCPGQKHQRTSEHVRIVRSQANRNITWMYTYICIYIYVIIYYYIYIITQNHTSNIRGTEPMHCKDLQENILSLSLSLASFSFPLQVSVCLSFLSSIPVCSRLF